MMKLTWRRTLSVVLSLAMTFGMTGTNTVFAAQDGVTISALGLCEHHRLHTAECGYTEEMPETPCMHEHTDACFEEVANCVHEHTGDCYDDAEDIATDSNAQEPVNCEHICDGAGGCISTEPDCQHSHDEDCEYVTAVSGTPCRFECGECVKDSGQQTLPPVDNALPQTVTAPALSNGSVSARYSDTLAKIKFTTDEAGDIYYLVKNSGEGAPAKEQVKAGTKDEWGAVADPDRQDFIEVTLTAGAKDVYLVVEDAAGNVSEPLKVAVDALKAAKMLSVGGVSITDGDWTLGEGHSSVPHRASISAANSVSEISVSNITISGEATATVYTDPEFSNPGTVTLTEGMPTAVYIRVENGQTNICYRVDVTQQAADTTKPTDLISRIDTWDPDGAGTTHSAAQVSVSWNAETATVTVSDHLTGNDVFNASWGLKLDIPAGITVKWQPSCNFSADGLFISGEGDFVLDGAVKLTAQSSFAQTNHAAIINDGGNVTIPGFTKVQATGSANKPAIYNNGTLEVSGTISAEGGNAIYNESGAETELKDGATVSASNNGAAIENSGDCTLIISGGTVSQSKDYTAAVVNHGFLTMTGGEITSTGTQGKGLTTSGGSSSLVSGGTISVSDTDGTALNISGGTITLTDGIINGPTDFNGSKKSILAYLTSVTCPLPHNIADDGGTVVEIDSLSIPVSRHGTNEGISIKVAGQTWDGRLTTTAKWDTSGDTPQIVVDVVDTSDTYTYTAKIDWGTKTSGDIQPAFTSADNYEFGSLGGYHELAVKGFTPTSYTLSGTVPSGVSTTEMGEGEWILMVQAGVQAGVHTFTITATDGSTTITQSFTLTVKPDTATVTVTTAMELINTLQSPTPTPINVTADIALAGSTSLLMVAMGADHTLNIAEGITLTIGGGTGNNDAALININGHTLTVTGGKVLINNYGSNGIYGNPGTLNLENVQVDVTNSMQSGLGNIQTLNMKDGATVTLSGDGDSLMRINDGQTVTVETGGSVTITKSSITLYGGNLHINGGSIHVNNGSGSGIRISNSSTLKLSSGTLDGIGTILLYMGGKVVGLGGKFTDRGAKLTESGVVTVGMPSVSPDQNRLTDGDYTWDAGSNTFSKPGYTVSGTVKNSGGKGISGAAVTLEYLFEATAYEAGTATTDADGSYTFSNISASLYSTNDGDKEYEKEYRIKASKDGYAEIAGECFSVAGNDVTGKDITLTAGGTATYPIGVINGTASPTTAAAGATVTLIANAAQNGDRFKEWVISPAVTFTDGTSKTSATAKFTMPNEAVSASATYENIPAGKLYEITFDPNGGTLPPGLHGPLGNFLQTDSTTGRLVDLPTATRSSYRFDGWFTAVTGGTQITLNTVFAQNTTIYAHWTYTGGSTGNGGGSSGGSTIVTTPATQDKPNPPATAETQIPVTVDNNDSASVTVPDKNITDAIKAAQDAAKKVGTEKNGISVALNLTTDRVPGSIAATLSKASVDTLIVSGVTEVNIRSGAVNISLDLATLKEIQKTVAGDVTISAAKVDVKTLSAAAQAAIGNRPVFRFSITGNGKAVSSFGGGRVSLAIPYTLQEGENAGNMQAVYIDGNGSAHYMTNSSYHSDCKALLFTTGHFSIYGVAYRTDTPKFTDTANHWAKDDIDFVAARGLLSGISENEFSPDTGMTRGMFVTALGRLAGVDTNSYQTSKFTDVKADAYYAPYVNWAAEKNIVNGTTDTTFAPDSAITREQMAVIMTGYANAMGYTIPKSREAVTFADAANIASWAKDAVKAMQMAGVVTSKDGNRFDPAGTATRAEAAAVLRRYVELVINPATAQGWTQNDVGQWLYYENGKLVTGWKLVDGKWYYLYADGSMAVNTKIDGYEVGADGARIGAQQ